MISLNCKNSSYPLYSYQFISINCESMGAARSRLKNSKHKDKVKEFFDHFRNKNSIETSKKWFNDNLEPGVKLRVESTGHLPKRIDKTDWVNAFIKYYEEFMSAHSL